MSEHDALVLPTYFEGEGIPGVIVEALQSGLPVISIKWRSIPGIIQDEKNGLLVEPRDSDSLGHAMGRLASDSRLYKRLAACARITGHDYDNGKWHSQLDAWFREVVKPGGKELQVTTSTGAR